MFAKISTSYKLVKIAFGIIMQEKELLGYTLLSVLCSVLILLTFAGIAYPYQEQLSQLTNWEPYWMYIGLFIYYLILSFITFFFNTAVITSVTRIIRWEWNKFGDGIKDSMNNLGKIFQWALVAATVSLIIKIFQDKFKDSAIAQIIIWGAWAAWSIMTFFAFPLMILRGMWVKDSIKESASLFKKTWWERAVIAVWVWLFWFLIILGIIAISIIIMIWVNILVWIAILVLWIFGVFIFSSLSDVVIKTIIFDYANTGKVPSMIQDQNIMSEIITEKTPKK